MVRFHSCSSSNQHNEPSYEKQLFLHEVDSFKRLSNNREWLHSNIAGLPLPERYRHQRKCIAENSVVYTTSIYTDGSTFPVGDVIRSSDCEHENVKYCSH